MRIKMVVRSLRMEAEQFPEVQDGSRGRENVRQEYGVAGDERVESGQIVIGFRVRKAIHIGQLVISEPSSRSRIERGVLIYSPSFSISDHSSGSRPHHNISIVLKVGLPG